MQNIEECLLKKMKLSEKLKQESKIRMGDSLNFGLINISIILFYFLPFLLKIVYSIFLGVQLKRSSPPAKPTFYNIWFFCSISLFVLVNFLSLNYIQTLSILVITYLSYYFENKITSFF